MGKSIWDAAAVGDVKQLEKLLNTGFDVNAINKEKRNFTPLHFACNGGHLNAAAFLLQKGANIHAMDAYNMSPIHVACSNGGSDIVKLLVDAGADIHRQDFRGLVPLHHATNPRINSKIVTVLVSSGAEVNVSDCLGNTPLHSVCAAGGTELALWFIEQGADLQARNVHGRTPLAYEMIEKSAAQLFRAWQVRQKAGSDKGKGRMDAPTNANDENDETSSPKGWKKDNAAMQARIRALEFKVVQLERENLLLLEVANRQALKVGEEPVSFSSQVPNE
jgi:hypothetical protein